MYPGLNAFRAFAFLAVFFYHEALLGAGYLGVPAFFVLSGFLLTPILVEMKEHFDARRYFVRFYGRRALRIFPLYYFYLGITALCCLVAMAWWPGQVIDDVTHFVPQWSWGGLFLVDIAFASNFYEPTRLLNHFWSLAVEEQFYLLWPLVIFLVPRSYLPRLLLGLAVLAPLFRWVIASEAASEALPFLTDDLPRRVYVLPFSHMDALALGSYFALYRKSGPSWTVWALFGGVWALGVVTTWYSGLEVNPSDLGYPPIMRDAGKYVWGYTVLNIAFAHGLVHIRDSKFLPWIFEMRALDYLGKISYGLYVYHFGVMLLVRAFLPDLGGVPRIVLDLTATIAVSAASYEFFEKRFLRLKDRYFLRETGD